MLTDVFKRNVAVLRIAEGEYINGVWYDGDNIPFTIRASVHPTPAEVLETLPEGYRNRDSYTLYTNTRLYTSIDNKTTPDIVYLDDRKYLVAKILSWQNTILSHYEVVVVEDERDGT